MEQRGNKRRIRRRRRLLRRLVILGYRCGMVALLAAVLILAVRCYRSIAGPDTQRLADEGYPESLVKLLEKNPETEQFVTNYWKNQDKKPVLDLSGEVTQGVIPLFLQWDERWGYETYGSDFLAVTGCGPTCLSMVRCGLGGDTRWNPLEVAKLAEDEGYYVPGAGSSWDLMTEGAAQLGLIASNVIYDREHILEKLREGTPIICIMGPGDFTTSGHFIVLTGADGDGMVTVCDPNSRRNSEKSWDVETLLPQIKNLWGYEYGE